jgi:hypothetical protein
MALRSTFTLMAIVLTKTLIALGASISKGWGQLQQRGRQIPQPRR